MEMCKEICAVNRQFDAEERTGASLNIPLVPIDESFSNFTDLKVYNIDADDKMFNLFFVT